MKKTQIIPKIRFTKEGYDKLRKDYDDFLKQRPEAVEHVKKAREMGDLSENGYYKASKAKLGFIDSQLARIKFQLQHAEIVKDDETDAITINKTVTISNGKKQLTYTIVGDLEANPANGKISLLSPLGKALNGKKEGNIIEIETPSGKITYSIVSIK